MFAAVEIRSTGQSRAAVPHGLRWEFYLRFMDCVRSEDSEGNWGEYKCESV
jgi:hypothetical protein